MACSCAVFYPKVLTMMEFVCVCVRVCVCVCVCYLCICITLYHYCLCTLVYPEMTYEVDRGVKSDYLLVYLCVFVFCCMCVCVYTCLCVCVLSLCLYHCTTTLCVLLFALR